MQPLWEVPVSASSPRQRYSSWSWECSPLMGPVNHLTVLVSFYTVFVLWVFLYKHPENWKDHTYSFRFKQAVFSLVTWIIQDLSCPVFVFLANVVCVKTMIITPRTLSLALSGNGYCRSEGIVVILLQKRVNAKRVYSTLLHSKNNADGNKEQGKYVYWRK